ncbi:MAG: regulatory protein RecX [Crocinitomicaceae bacterium]|jgi:regulatory protein
MQSYSPSYSFEQALVKMEAWCAYQDRCLFEVQNKLNSWNIDFSVQEKIIEKLILNRFLDEKRFVESYVSGKVRIKRWGRIKIKYQLSQKRVDKKLIEQGLKTIDLEIYWDNLIALATRKSSEIKPSEDPWKAKQKIMTYLASKGYEQDLIFEAVKVMLR